MGFIVINKKLHNFTCGQLMDENKKKSLWEGDFSAYRPASYKFTRFINLLLPSYCLIGKDSWINLYTGIEYPHKFKSFMGRFQDSLFYYTTDFIYEVSIWGNKMIRKWKITRRLSANLSSIYISFIRVGDSLYVSDKTDVILYRVGKEDTPLKGTEIVAVKGDYVVVTKKYIYNDDRAFSVYNINDPNELVYEYKRPPHINETVPWDSNYVGISTSFMTLYDIWGATKGIIRDERVSKYYTVENDKFILLRGL